MTQDQMEANFSHNLKGLMAESGDTYLSLAYRLGVNASTVGHWCTGYAKPSIGTLSKVCAVFKTTIDEILLRRVG